MTGMHHTTRANPSGARPISQTRRPSSENCGKTKRVVMVARLSEQAPRLRKLVMETQNAESDCRVKWRRFIR